MRALIPLFMSVLLSGCLARTALDVVTLPVRVGTAVVGSAIDAATTSRAEADRERGRRLREEDERRGREARQEERRRRADARRSGADPDTNSAAPR